MNSPVKPAPQLVPPGLEPAHLIEADGWRLWELPVLDSTNAAAAPLEAWNAVRAERQTAGRGRFQRQWVSDDGGLWLSAVVPTEALGDATKLLPLLAGLAVCRTAAQIGLSQLRMRWPNDVMIGDHKLAGILIDQPRAGVAVVGIGLNVTNHPEKVEPSLVDHVARLSDFLAHPPSPQDLALRLLRDLRAVVDEAGRGGAAQAVKNINQLWGKVREVSLDLDGVTVNGRFLGVDDHGGLRLETRSHKHIVYESHHVRQLHEI
jgi:BirA family transcriptional regulator, biotin operon repressor / biotin---[acetyl-CoA-carboxylase] ligase